MSHWQFPVGCRVPFQPSATLEDVFFCSGPHNSMGPQLPITECVVDNFHNPHMSPQALLVNHDPRHFSTMHFHPDYQRSRKRIVDIINQCRYLSSKKGMNKRELVASIERDEKIGRFYDNTETFNPSRCIDHMPVPMPMDQSFSPYWFAPGGDVQRDMYYGHGNIMNNQNMFIPPEEIEVIQDEEDFDKVNSRSAEYPGHRRPPTRRNATRTKIVSQGKDSSRIPTMGEDDSSSEESYFYPTETEANLIHNKINDKTSLHNDAGESEDYSSGSKIIPAIRKPGTHNFSLLLNRNEPKKENQQKVDQAKGLCDSLKEEEDDDEISCCAYSDLSDGCISLGDDCNTSDEDAQPVEYISTTESLIKKRLEMLQSSESSIFGSVDDYGKMFFEEAKDAAAEQEDLKNKQDS